MRTAIRGLFMLHCRAVKLAPLNINLNIKRLHIAILLMVFFYIIFIFVDMAFIYTGSF